MATVATGDAKPYVIRLSLFELELGSDLDSSEAANRGSVSGGEVKFGSQGNKTSIDLPQSRNVSSPTSKC